MLETLLALELCLLVRALQQSRLQRRTPQTSLWMPLLSRWLRMRLQGRNPALDGGKAWPSMRSVRCLVLQSLMNLLLMGAQMTSN